MKIEKINNPIAQRTLQMGGENITVVVGKPETFEDGQDFYCPYSIKYGERNRMSYAGGVDSVQALRLAMKKIHVDLSYLSESEKRPFSWLDNDNFITGFDD